MKIVNQNKAPFVTIIVPCYNSERTIRQCLTSIENQRTTISYHVIVVDSSTDRTPEIVRQEFPGVRLIHLEKRTYAGAARNIGARATEAPFCLMIDSDCILSPDVLERMAKRLQESNYAAVSGALRNGTPRSLSGWIAYLIEFKEFMPTAPQRFEKGVPAAIVAYRSDILKKYGYFDEEMWLAEDILLGWKMYRGGEKILFDPTIQATHLNRTGWRPVLSYQVSLGRLSAVARKRGGLPGGMLLRYPMLILLMPFVRTLNAAKWLAIHDGKSFLLFLFIWPFYLLAASFWSYGFLRQAIGDR